MTSFNYAPAVRSNVPLLIAVAGVSGSGKTFSALKVARGLAGGRPDMTGEQLAEIDKRILVIDTEAGRALHYAPAPGELPSATTFGFMHADLAPPFSPERISEAIAGGDAAGFAVIVLDSTSHEYNGEGGITELHDLEVEAAVARARKFHSGNYPFDPDKAAEKASVGAWKLPKTRHKRMVNKLLQSRAHLVLCLRAEEKIKMETIEEEGSGGRTFKKTVITQAKDLPDHERYVPICEKQFMYEMGLSFILSPARPGYPIPIKLQDQHREAVPLDRPLDERTGLMLARWARGGAKKERPQPDAAAEGKTLAQIAEEYARKGSEAYAAYWQGLGKADRGSIGKAEHERLKGVAADADKGVAA